MPFPYVFPFVFPGGGGPPASTLPDRSQGTARRRRGPIEAILDAAAGMMNDLVGQGVTRISAPLSATSHVVGVESTIGFGETVDGTLRARFLVGGEIMEAATRTQSSPYGFVSVIRGVDGTAAKAHPAGTIVLDLSQNTSAIHFLRRGFFIDTAVEEDLDVIARNLGVHKCFGLTGETWRRVIKTMAYLPKQPLSAFRDILEALMGNSTSFRVHERPWSDPWTIFAEIDVPANTDDDAVEGHFVLTGGEQQFTTGALTVDVTYEVGSVLGVFLATTEAIRGERYGMTNYYTGGGGSFAGQTITLDSSPGGPGTAVIIDYSVNAELNYHYLAADETVVADLDEHRPYFGDAHGPLAECLLDGVRSAGMQVVITQRTV